LPPLDKNGGSPFWEHIGKKFTGMDYKEANAKCRTNAEFIFSLFPHTLIYATLLPDKVRKLIGAVHPKTIPVKGLLESIGFRYVREVCPFDGGPHYRAELADISLIKRVQIMKVRPENLDLRRSGLPLGLAGRDDKGQFRACPCRIDFSTSEAVFDPDHAKEADLKRGQTVTVLPLS